jgi:hypothetical protein
MNKEWSEANKSMQDLIKKRETFSDGISALFQLRDELMQVMLSFRDELSREDFNSMPFINAKGYHSKSIAYSLWHIFRIEDIVAHTLINNDEQVLFASGYADSINSPIITTGNELTSRQIDSFSRQLDISMLYAYIAEVKSSTETLLSGLSFDMLKNKVSPEQKRRLRELNVVSSDENAVWLIDYWCSKDVAGLIRMPFSRHWIMHIEACLRIANKLK